MQDTINPNAYRHTHNGIDAQQIELRDVLYAKADALTTADVTTLSTGGIANLNSTDSAIINNMRIRINELEARLKQFNLIQ